MSPLPIKRAQMNRVQRGLPGALPAGERLLWQGAPDWRVLARRAMHARKLAAYFGLIALWVGISGLVGGGGLAAAARSTAIAAAIGAVPVLLAVGYAWAVSRATVYTITNRRVVLQVGLALPVSFNLPLARVAGADVARHAGGGGDLSLTLDGADRLSWVVLWPHVRAWRLRRPQPTLRGLRDVAEAAQILARVLAEDVPASHAALAA